MKLKLIFAWYDLWIGFFVDKKKKKVYFFPIPTIGIVLEYGFKPLKHCGFSVGGRIKCLYGNSGNKFYSELFNSHPKIDKIRWDKNSRMYQLGFKTAKNKYQWFYENGFKAIRWNENH